MIQSGYGGIRSKLKIKSIVCIDEIQNTILIRANPYAGFSRRTWACGNGIVKKQSCTTLRHLDKCTHRRSGKPLVIPWSYFRIRNITLNTDQSTEHKTHSSLVFTSATLWLEVDLHGIWFNAHVTIPGTPVYWLILRTMTLSYGLSLLCQREKPRLMNERDCKNLYVNGCWSPRQ